MRVSSLLTLAIATVLPFAFAKDDDPAYSDTAASTAEDACYAKTLSTGSGAAAAIKGFCAQVENNDSNTDNPDSAADTSMNGYTAGGFDPSGVTTTARLAATKNGCNADLGDEEDCLSGFWEVCSKGDKFGRGVTRKGCLELRIE
ncbi:hypothetical protein MBLNU13_g08825t1 [Cladosporium sp. NU13]